MNWKRALLFVGLTAIVAVALLRLFANYCGDWLWFLSLGLGQVFATVFWAKLLTFSAFFLVFAIAGGANIYIARRFGAKTRSLDAAASWSPVSLIYILFHDKRAPYLWSGLLVFAAVLWAKLLILSAFFLMFAMVGLANVYLAKRSRAGSQSPPVETLESPAAPPDFFLLEKRLSCVWVLLILLLSGIMGQQASKSWLTLLKSIHQSPFGVADPIFSRDAAFYVFTLPLHFFLKRWCLLALLFVIGAVGLSYFLDQAIEVRNRRICFNSKSKAHLTILLGLVALVMAWSYRLKIYGLLYSGSGVVRGAGYADVHARIPAYWLLLVFSLLMAFLFFAIPVIKRWKWTAYVIGAYLVVLIGLSWIYPRVIERYVVKPDELAKESPYISNNIKFTRLGFGLDKAREEFFPAEDIMSYDDIESNESTIHNIRLWDHRPLIQSYKQLQEIRLYYNFKNVDMDRYKISGRYTEVALAGRELPVAELPDTARTWVNTHLVYTHGYGVVMSPVNESTADGMPRFIVQDIPPKSAASVSITRPEIYYGEETDRFAVVHTTTREFDYPKGGRNVYTTYHGTGGVKLSSHFRRLIYALRLSDLNLLLSGCITEHSRVMLNRVISNRDRIIAPFLTYDADPYLVVGEDGHLYWIHDAYTTTNMFPYSESLNKNRNAAGINYIRNSVEVVVDAYNGDVSFYLVDPSDPLAQTYAKIFPALFKTAEDMPASLRAHLRYPRDMFVKQAKMYATYHMTDPQVLYNREDLWSIPQSVYTGEKKQAMAPYYIIMKLPDAVTEEFILMLPMTPSKKDNMVAWMCARCDGENRGQLLIYALPKTKLIYGPRQIEARINQQPSITSEMTLWDQMGSSVVRGNLLIIPIAHSFMYIEPIYLQSKEGQIPQLKRVIAVQNGELEMGRNLDAALRSVFAAIHLPEGQQQKAVGGLPPGVLPEMAEEALKHYNKAQEYLKQANWNKYGEELERLRQILQVIAGNEAAGSIRSAHQP
jgi:uncharacterized membrane protein (UPF0182 family)